MAKIEIYTSPLCGYCRAAKHLLDSKGLRYEEYDVLVDSKRRTEMMERSEGRWTVPQIFIDSVGIGGFDDLRKLEASQQLDGLVA